MGAFGRLGEQTVADLEGEEPDARASSIGDVGAQLELERRGEPGQGRQASCAQILDPKTDDTEPRLALEDVETEARRDEPCESFGVDAPVDENDVSTGVCLRPRGVGQRPRPARDVERGIRLPRDRIEEVVPVHREIVSYAPISRRPAAAAARAQAAWERLV